MSKYQLKRDIHAMFRWAISKAFEQNPNDIISLRELQDVLSKTWSEMVEDGDVVIQESEQ